MITEKITIANLKCSGCESTITKKLKETPGVESVTVNQAEDAVTIVHNGTPTRVELTKKLHDIGYPEATEENGLLLKLKSYVSCAMGRMNS